MVYKIKPFGYQYELRILSTVENIWTEVSEEPEGKDYVCLEFGKFEVPWSLV